MISTPILFRLTPSVLANSCRSISSDVFCTSNIKHIMKLKSPYKTKPLLQKNERFYDSGGYCYFCQTGVDKDPNMRYIDFSSSLSIGEEHDILKNMLVIESFVSEEEEKSLLDEILPYMKRLRYEFSHWDNAIHAYRETERLKWTEENTKIIDRIRDFAFLPGSPQLHHVHILDLADEGYIKPHIDSVRFCGNTIAGLSLLSDAVMRLVQEKDKSKTVDVLLNRRSLYIMRDAVRYDYTHEILPSADSKFKNQNVEKRRRISVICRNEPLPSASS